MFNMSREETETFNLQYLLEINGIELLSNLNFLFKILFNSIQDFHHILFFHMENLMLKIVRTG